jgi:hypothetical protein
MCTFAAMEEEKRLVRSVPNPVFLAGSGVALIAAGGLLPFLQWPIVGIAAVWGLYTVITRKGDNTAGWISLAAAGGVALLGGFIANTGKFAGWVLLAAGAISLVSKLFRRGKES